MKKYAIYARKSVLREDSISIESQIELCKEEIESCRRKLKDKELFDIVIYSDNGYSGKNTDRPNYQRMIRDIRNGKIDKVFVYRLDRISRSVLDFSSMMDLFQKYKVDFISTTEDFDTSSPMGRAMLNICIVFAQLERETIQQRVIDAYLSRSRKGFYMGGNVPYGFRLTPTTIDGIKTSMYTPIPEEADDVRMIYRMYSNPTTSLGDIQKELQSREVAPNRRRIRSWCSNRIASLIKNPTYTSNDIRIYQFYKSKGSILVDPAEAYDGKSSIYLYKGEDGTDKQYDLQNKVVVIAPHQGLVDPETWLICRKKLLSNHKMPPATVKNTFLAGKIKCGYCGYALTVRMSVTPNARTPYFLDSGRYKFKCCPEKMAPCKSEDVEKIIVERMAEKLETLTIKSKDDEPYESQGEIRLLEIEIEKINDRINTLIQNLAEANDVVMSYVNENVSNLDARKKELYEEIDKLKESRKHIQKYNELKNVMSKWDDLSFDDKRNVVSLLIRRINVYLDRIEIEWNV